MEGLRGLAALLVLFVHFHVLMKSFVRPGAWGPPTTLFLASLGQTGVDLFFVLSGFLMYGVMLKPSFRYVPYLIRRLQRLYPVFLGVFACYLILSHFFPESSKLPQTGTVTYLLVNLFMLPGMYPVPPMITVAWSLSYEWFFYLSAPLVVLGFGLRSCSRLQRCIFLLLLAGLHLGLCIGGYSGHPRLVMFIAGCLLLEGANGGWWKGELVTKGEWLAIGAVLLNWAQIGWGGVVIDNSALFAGNAGSASAALFVTNFWFIGYALCFRGWLARLLSLAPLRWLGNISYSYYLAHGMTLHGLQRLLVKVHVSSISTGAYAVLFLVSLIVTFAVAVLFYVTLERPFLARKSLESRQPATVG